MTPTLVTPRLLLRAPVVADAAQILVFRGDPEVQRFNDEPFRTVGECEVFVEWLLAETVANLRRHWAIEVGGTVIGLIGLHSWKRPHRRAELGYDIARAHWGMGIAAEAARAVLEYGFREMGLHRVEAYTIADNDRSVRLLERLGFRREGTRRDFSLGADGAYHHSAVFGLLREEFGQHRQSTG